MENEVKQLFSFNKFNFKKKEIVNFDDKDYEFVTYQEIDVPKTIYTST